jgi:DNA polymerase (family X)
MRTLAASEVAKLLHEFGQRISFRGGNPYRARAYTRAAENLLTLAEPLEDIVAQNRLREIPGVGNAIADIVTKLHRMGRHPALDAMRTSGFLKSLLRISLCYANPCIRLSEAPYA